MEKEELLKAIDDKLVAFKNGLTTGVSKDELTPMLSTLKNELTEQFKGAITETVLTAKFEEFSRNIAKDIETKLEKGMGNNTMTIEQAIAKKIAEKQPEIIALLQKGSGVIEIDVTKEVGDITTANGSVPVAAPAIMGVQEAPIANINLRDLRVEQFMTVLQTSNGSAYPYTETVPKDGDYTFVAEGVAKPQIDFEWETRYATPKKIAAWIKLTEEAVKDVRGLESVARDFLRKKHDLKKAKYLLFADGLSTNPKGATTYGRAFVPGSMQFAIPAPNFMDVVNACIVDIATTHNYEDEVPYRANLVMVNSVDFFLNVVSAKTEEGVPLYPTASLFNQVTIGGVTIIPDESIPSGKIFVADLGKYNITNYVPYMVKVGWINDDFIKNQFVILGESRFHQFVKKLDEQAFIYDDFATIKAAITAPLVVAGEEQGA